MYEALIFHDMTSADGNAFQALIGTYLSAAYGNDFQRIISVQGDGGCDGYRRSNKTVYQCYGKERPSAVNVSYIVTKINNDFALALRTFGLDRMRAWIFVHNLTAGLPNPANLAIETLRQAHPTIDITTMTKDGLQAILFAQDDNQLEALFGPAERSFSDIEPGDISRLLRGIALDVRPPSDRPITPVPRDKIEYNDLSEPAARIIRDNIQYAAQVAKFVTEDPDPLFGVRVSEQLNASYQLLKAQNLPSDQILSSLLERVIGLDKIEWTPGEWKAAEAIVAYFFSNCDIFEDAPR